MCIFFENIVSVFQPHGDGALTSPPTPLTPTNYTLTISYSFPFLHLAHYSQKYLCPLTTCSLLCKEKEPSFAQYPYATGLIHSESDFVQKGWIGSTSVGNWFFLS